MVEAERAAKLGKKGKKKKGKKKKKVRRGDKGVGTCRMVHVAKKDAQLISLYSPTRAAEQSTNL
eukprot:scaffold302826_cov13-Tisochrysis_lutea.AAC.1